MRLLELSNDDFSAVMMLLEDNVNEKNGKGSKTMHSPAAREAQALLHRFMSSEVED